MWRSTRGVYKFLGGGGVVYFILRSMSILNWWKNITGRYEEDVETGKPERFTLRYLRKITDDFSTENLIGRGGFGKVYKATLSTGKMVAIKKLTRTASDKEGLPTFKTEIQLLSRIHYRNLVNLVGFCYERKEEILVYEFVSNGTLKEKLQGNEVGNRLDWMKRLQIALDVAKGLSYLHNDAEPAIIHRDIKPDNILLDVNLTAKIADFGISKLIPDGSYVKATKVAGTGVYLDPQYSETKKLDKRSDVYSFGIVMLELMGLEMTGSDLTSFRTVERFRSSWEDANKSHRSLRDMMHLPLTVPNDQLVSFDSFVELAFDCIKERPVQRPRIADVVKEIQIIMNKDDRSIAANEFYTAIE